jgi:hypothetical protein
LIWATRDLVSDYQTLCGIHGGARWPWEERVAGGLGTDRWSAGRSRPDGARREEEGGGLRDRLGTRVASGNEPREGARGSDVEAVGRGARARERESVARHRVPA